MLQILTCDLPSVRLPLSCKRYEKLPIAVLREAVPYDFGGIDIIDELPLPTPRSPGERDEGEAEAATQSTVPEPSLTNVVTAAEDFIKVLATVSSSTADSDKGESQSSEKNKRKKKEKKKTGKKQKGKGKWRRRKQKAEAAAVSTPGGGAEDVKALSNFISESQMRHRSSEKAEVVDGGGGGGLELGGEEKPMNEVMKDEPAAEKETASTSPTDLQKKPEPAVSTTTAAGPRRARPKQWRRGWRLRGEAANPPLSKAGPPGNTTDAPATTPAAGPQERLRSGGDGGKVKQSRSKERRVKVGGKKRRKDSSGGASSPTVAAPPTAATPPAGSFSVGYLESIPLTGTPTVTTLSHRQDAHRGRQRAEGGGHGGGGGAHNSPLSHPEQRKSQKKRLKGSKSKKGPFLPPSPESSSPAVETDIVTEWRLYATATLAPSVTTEMHTQTAGQQRTRKSRRRKKKDKPSSAATAAAAIQGSPQTPAKSQIPLAKEIRLPDKTPYATTSATPTMSPRQLSIERAKAQFSRKKRRKAALSRSPA